MNHFMEGRRAAVRRLIAAGAGLAVLVAIATPAQAGDPVLGCEKSAAKNLEKCVQGLSKVVGKCYAATGATCADADADVAKVLAKLDSGVRKKCASDADVQSAGYGAAATVDGLAARLASVCESETASLSARTFGGPHAAGLNAQAGLGNKPGVKCMLNAHKTLGKMIAKNAKARSKCIDATRKGKTCDQAKTDGKVAGGIAKASDGVAGKCASKLDDYVLIDPIEQAARADAQSRCLTAYGHPDTTPIDIDCGPSSDTLVSAPRGSYVQVVLDEEVWGTRCGDGSPYAFQIRLAPEGNPLENVLIALEGGGVCVFEDDCDAIGADLFEAQSDPAPTAGIMSTDPGVSPFANWTKVFMPYCTQDVFFGGGSTSDFTPSVHRFGAINLRAAMRYVRDLLWQELAATDPEGYHPEVPSVMFGGFSAGAFGTLYNYHWVLDDLQWKHTAAFPDAGLGLDTGTAASIATLGAFVLPDESPATPNGWGSANLMPQYCFESECAYGPIGLAAAAPRLGIEPEQQFLVLTNQVDDTQQSTTFFSDMPSWTNELRTQYCNTKDLNGVHYFMPAISSSVHVISPVESLFTTYSIGGEIMRDWLADGYSTPAGVVNRVEEGTLVDDVPGVNAFPCALD